MTTIDTLTDLSDEKIEALFERFGIILTIEDVVFTAATIQDFLDSREKWAERGSLDRFDDALFPSIRVERGQPRKGMARGQTIVIDLGDKRAVFSDHSFS